MDAYIRGISLPLVKFLERVTTQLDEFFLCFNHVRQLAVDIANLAPWRLLSLGMGGGSCKHAVPNAPTMSSVPHVFFMASPSLLFFTMGCVWWLSMVRSMHGEGEGFG